jgi:hypothetical protein
MAGGKSWDWTYERIGDSVDIVLELIGNVENTIKKSRDGAAPIEGVLQNVIDKARQLKDDLNEARRELYAATHQLGATPTPPTTEDLVVAPFRDAKSTVA